MKKALLTMLVCLIASISFADSIFIEGFEYANHDLTTPIGWTCNDQSWLCGYLEKDHNRVPHSGNWYAFTNAEDSWMFMPLFFSSTLRYRPSYWAISDGTFQVEFWAGNQADPQAMTRLLFTATVNSGTYERFTEYIENLSSNYEYFGIHAIAGEGATHLTLDDIYVDMVNKYDLEVTPYQIDTVMYPGSQITFEYEVQNTGYEDLEIYMTPYTDFFTNIHFTEDGHNGSTFPTVPNQMVHCSCTATLSPNIAPGTLCWMDIMFTVSCDCVTRMATVWVTAIAPAETNEQKETVMLYPNPVEGYIDIQANGLQRVEIANMNGEKVINIGADQDAIQLDLQRLHAGVYFVTIVTELGVSTRKIIKK